MELLSIEGKKNGTPTGRMSEPESTEQPTQASASPTRIIVADSQAIYRVGIRKILALEDDLRVVAQAENLTGLHAAIQRFPTDIVLLESSLLGGTHDGIAEILKKAPEAKLAVQVVETDEATTVELYRRGVRAVIPRSISPDLLVKCIRKIASGETWIDNQSINWVIEAYRAQAQAMTAPRTQPHLTERELSIIACITQGMRNKEIAYQVGTTEQVIKNYLRKIYDKLGVSDRLELALYCLHHQILTKPQGAAAKGTLAAVAAQAAVGK